MDIMDAIVQNCSGVALSLCERTFVPFRPVWTALQQNHFGQSGQSCAEPLNHFSHEDAKAQSFLLFTRHHSATSFWTSWAIFLVPVLTFNLSSFSRFQLPQSGNILDTGYPHFGQSLTTEASRSRGTDPRVSNAQRNLFSLSSVDQLRHFGHRSTSFWTPDSDTLESR